MAYRAVLAQLGVAVTGKQVLAVLPDRGVDVHAATVVTEDWLRHEGGGLAMLVSGVLHGVLQLVHVVTTGDDGAELHAHFALTSGCNLVVADFNLHAHGHHVQSDFVTEVHQGIGWADREVTALGLDLVAQVEAIVAAAGPVCFDAVDFVEAAPAWLGSVTDAVEDEELWLWASVGHVTDAGALQVGEGLLDDRTWAAVVELTGTWLEHVTDHAQRGVLTEWIEVGAIEVGLEQHVRLVDGLPSADRRTVERLKPSSKSLRQSRRQEW